MFYQPSPFYHYIPYQVLSYARSVSLLSEVKGKLLHNTGQSSNKILLLIITNYLVKT